MRVQGAWELEVAEQCVLRALESGGQAALVRTDFAFEPYVEGAADLVVFSLSSREASTAGALAVSQQIRASMSSLG